MAVYGTENFVYYTDRILGTGSTGTVFFGRHKRKGDICAIKTFLAAPGSKSRLEVRENELEFMRVLKHDNIVTLLAIEKDSKTSDVVLIMELCSEGSLQKRLSQPEFLNGLAEKEFLVFIVQFAAGLSYLRLHGVTHRDIKPGNILCNRKEDGSIVYKITDFGSSRELLSEDRSKALYGTEEYLHPAVYRCIFIDKIPYGDEFEENSELWSIGVTIFQVATGQLPFQVEGGRNNRDTMYRLISMKSTGVISAKQKESHNKEFEEKTQFPTTCSLSQSLTDILVPLISGLLENDFEKQMKFDSFFPKCEEFKSLVVVDVFYVPSSLALQVYLKPNDRLIDLKISIEKMIGVSVVEQLLVFKNRLLEDTIEPEISIQLYPRTTEDSPVLLTFIMNPSQKIHVQFPDLPQIPDSNTDKNLVADANWSRDACAYLMRVYDVVVLYSRAQTITVQCINCFTENIILKFKSLKTNRLKMLIIYFKSIEFNIKLFRDKREEITRLTEKGFENEKSLTRYEFHANENVEKLSTQVDSKLQFIFDGFEKLRKKLKEIKISVIDNESVLEMRSDIFLSSKLKSCQELCCCKKIDYNVKLAKITYEQFTKDRQRQLSYNEDQIHKYEKIKLEQKIKTVTAIVFNHCLPKSVEINKKMNKWLIETFNRRWCNIRQIDEDMKALRLSLSQLSNETDELYNLWDELLKNFMPSNVKDVFKSSGYHTASETAVAEDVASIPSSSPYLLSSKELKAQIQLIKYSVEDHSSRTRHIFTDMSECEELIKHIDEYLTE